MYIYNEKRKKDGNMNKYIEKVEKYKEKVLLPALEKLKTECEEAEDFFRDTGYDRYFNKMQKCESQIEEIEEYLGESQKKEEITSSEYKELLQLRETMKNIKTKVFYLSKELPMCVDLINLKDLLRDY